MTGSSALLVTLTVLFLIGLAKAVRTYLFVRRATRVRVKVVGSTDVTGPNHETDTQTAHTYRFKVELPGPGRSVRRVDLKDAFGGAFTKNLVDEYGTIPVLYDPARSGVVRIDKPWALYFVPAFLCTPAILFVLLNIYVWLVV